jgi:hypothetical protein
MPTFTSTPTPEPSSTPTATPTDTPEPEPTNTPTAAPTDTPEPEPTNTPTSTPTQTATPPPTATSTLAAISPLAASQGCGPDFWFLNQSEEYWTDYDPSDSFADVFDVDAQDLTLLEMLASEGEAPRNQRVLRAEAVAALLNASHPDITFAFDEDEVIELVQDAFDTGELEKVTEQLHAENRQGCPYSEAQGGLLSPLTGRAFDLPEFLVGDWLFALYDMSAGDSFRMLIAFYPDF